MPAQRLLALQRLAGNRAVAELAARATDATRHPASALPLIPVQRLLDEEFEHGGSPTEAETTACHEFAETVSGLVDQAYADLMAGRVSAWHGTKLTTFLDLLNRGSDAATVHAGNAIEERVYALMRARDMKMHWVPQFSEAMGGASKPDIVIKVAPGDERGIGVKEALVDVTSDRGHVLGKAGGWTTSTRYVYVAEAYFLSITKTDVALIRQAVAEHGIDDAELRRRKAVADAEKAARLAALTAHLKAAREEYRSHGGTITALAMSKFGGNRRLARDWMRKNGLGSMKGVPALKGKRKPSADTKKKMRQKAAKVRAAKKREAASTNTTEDFSTMAGTSNNNSSSVSMVEQESKSFELDDDEDMAQNETDDLELVEDYVDELVL